MEQEMGKEKNIIEMGKKYKGEYLNGIKWNGNGYNIWQCNI